MSVSVLAIYPLSKTSGAACISKERAKYVCKRGKYVSEYKLNLGSGFVYLKSVVESNGEVQRVASK